jgi:phage gpG-like protein
MARLEWKSNFSFKKLSDNLDKAIDEFGASGVKQFADAAKKNLHKGDLRPLGKATLESRARNRYWGGKKDIPAIGTDPLIHTGSLSKSIKPTKDGITMNKYGIYHHQGFTTNKGKKIPARPFLPFGKLSDDNGSEAAFGKTNMKSLYKKLNRIMKK